MDCRPGVATQSLPQHPMPVLQTPYPSRKAPPGMATAHLLQSRGPRLETRSEPVPLCRPEPARRLQRNRRRRRPSPSSPRMHPRLDCSVAPTQRKHRDRSPLRRRPRLPSPRRFPSQLLLYRRHLMLALPSRLHQRRRRRRLQSRQKPRRRSPPTLVSSGVRRARPVQPVPFQAQTENGALPPPSARLMRFETCCRASVPVSSEPAPRTRPRPTSLTEKEPNE